MPLKFTLILRVTFCANLGNNRLGDLGSRVNTTMASLFPPDSGVDADVESLKEPLAPGSSSKDPPPEQEAGASYFATG